MIARAPFLALLLVLTASGSFASENAARFSHVLSAAELTETGISGLSSDQIAVLDALVRRDLTARLNGRGEESPKIFSERLTSDERRIAGLDALSAEQLGRVNAFVERFQSITVSRELLSPPVFVARRSAPTPRETTKDDVRQIHGTFSLSFGWGSGGYSERTGSMVVHSEVAPGMHVSVGYSETRVKGGEGLYYYRDDALMRPVPPIVTGPPLR